MNSNTASPMDRIPTSSGSSREPVPSGEQLARCCQVIGLGRQKTAWGDKDQCYISFEVPAHRVKWTDDKGVEHEGPAQIGAFFNLTMGGGDKPSKLREFVESWRGKPFANDAEVADFRIRKMLGVAGKLHIWHTEKNGNVRDEIRSILPVKQNLVADLEGPALYYDAWQPDAEAFSKLSPWFQEKVRQHNGTPATAAPSQGVEDDSEDEILF